LPRAQVPLMFSGTCFGLCKQLSLQNLAHRTAGQGVNHLHRLHALETSQTQAAGLDDRGLTGSAWRRGNVPYGSAVGWRLGRRA